MSSLTIQPSVKDSSLRQLAPTTNYGAIDHLFPRDQDGQTVRAILEFDVSALPVGATLISASLELYYYSKGYTDPVGKTIWMYKQIHTDWVELEDTWNIYKTGSDWTSAGGDCVTSNPGGGSTTFPAGYGWMTWNVLAIVQDAYGSSIVAEFLARFETEDLASGYSATYLYSNDYTGDISLCPRLVITYTTPGGRGWAQK